MPQKPELRETAEADGVRLILIPPRRSRAMEDVALPHDG
jgi:hypothetical protein